MKTIISILLVFSGLTSYGQTIEISTIDSGGASVSNGDINILYTIGEVAVSETVVGTIYLSEGFINSNVESALNINQNFFPESGVVLYPNPASDKVYINSNFNIERVEVYDVLGKLMFSRRTSSVIEISALSNGIYFFKFYNQGSAMMKKIIVER